METIKPNLSTEELNRIIGFLGYGNPSHSVWFIGFEEGLGNMTDEDTSWNLKARGQFDQIMDLHQAHLGLRQNGRPIDVSQKPPATQVWRWAAKIMRARDHHEDWLSKDHALSYISTSLGRMYGKTFLTEISPIPTRRTADVTWARWFAQHVEDLPKKVGDRKAALKKLYEESSPQKVFCYGLSITFEYAALLDVEWQPVCPGVLASKDSKCVLLPFFGNGCMSEKIVRHLVAHDLAPGKRLS